MIFFQAGRESKQRQGGDRGDRDGRDDFKPLHTLETLLDGLVKLSLVNLDCVPKGLVKPIEGPVGLTRIRADTERDGGGALIGGVEFANLAIEIEIGLEAGDGSHQSSPLSLERDVS